MNDIEQMRQEALDAKDDLLPEPEDIEDIADDETQPDDAREDALDDAEGRG